MVLMFLNEKKKSFKKIKMNLLSVGIVFLLVLCIVLYFVDVADSEKVMALRDHYVGENENCRRYLNVIVHTPCWRTSVISSIFILITILIIRHVYGRIDNLAVLFIFLVTFTAITSGFRWRNFHMIHNNLRDVKED